MARKLTEEEFYRELSILPLGSKYLEFIKDKQDLGREKGQGTYLEEHHIHPKTLGGSKKSKTVLLTRAEHIVAHYWLARIFRTPGLCQAFNFMCDRNLDEIDPEDKDWIISLEEREHLYVLGRQKTPETRKKQSKAARGRIQVYKGDKERKIYPDQLPLFEQEGWKKGRIYKVCSTKGLIWIHKSSEEKAIHPHQLSVFEQEGWSEGRSKSSTKGKKRLCKDSVVKYFPEEEYLQRLEEGWVPRGSCSGKKKLVSTIFGKSKWVPKESIQNFIGTGEWRLWDGRDVKDSTREKLTKVGKQFGFSVTMKGKTKIFKEGFRKAVSKEDLQNFLDQGWTVGWPSSKKGKPLAPCEQVWVHKEGKAMRVCIEDYPAYIKEGWVRGRKYDNRHYPNCKVLSI